MYFYDKKSRSILHMRKISNKICRENQDTFYVQYRFSKIVTFMR